MTANVYRTSDRTDSYDMFADSPDEEPAEPDKHMYQCEFYSLGGELRTTSTHYCDTDRNARPVLHGRRSDQT